MEKSGTRVGTFLLWLVCIVSLLLALLTAASIWRANIALFQQEQATLRGVARGSADRIDVTAQDLRSGLLTLATSSPLLRGNIKDAQQEIQAFSARTSIPVLLAGPDGRIDTPPAAQSLPIPDLETAAREAIAEHTPMLTNLLRGSSRQPDSVALIVPGRREDGSDFALAGLLMPDRLLGLAEPPRFSPDGLIITIFDRGGLIVTRSLLPAHSAGRPAPPKLRQAIRTDSAGIVTATLEGVQAMIAFERSAWGFTAAAIVPMDQFGAANGTTLLATLGAALIVFASALFIATRFNARLVRALRAIGQSGTDRPPPSGLREIDDLADRLHSLARQRDATEASLRDLLEKVDLAPIMAREMDGTIRFWSKGCVRMYGWLPEEAVGKSTHVLLRTQFPRSLADVEESLRETGEWSGDLVHRRRDGARIVAAAQKILRRGTGGAPDLVIESLVDVTALREAEDTLRAMNQTLEQRVQTEIAAREAAQQRTAQDDRIRVLGQLAGGIAHDFNNILQAITGSSALIARRPHDVETVSRFAAIITDAATRGGAITRRILLLARQGDLKPEPIDAAVLLSEIREVLVYTLGASIHIALDLAPDLPPLLTDRAQLETALVNLATNARDAMPDGGTLRMAADPEVGEPPVQTLGQRLPTPMSTSAGSYVRLTVSDTGTGMDAATLARVGEPFFTTKPFGKGTGLGLSMVRGFVEQSRGGFAISSEPNRGTTVSMWLPTAAVDAPARSHSSGTAVRIAQILLVDDDPLVRDTVAEQLEDLGHQVLSAAGGADALAILRAASAIDLMITDLSMPGMSGIMLIREAREVRPMLPAILLTGYATEANAIAQKDTIQADYTLIRKPASSAVLKARIGELLSLPV